MSTTAVTVGGIVKPDGTVEVSEKVNLPAGKVQVTLVPLSELSPDDPFWPRMYKIWDGQGFRGHHTDLLTGLNCTASRWARTSFRSTIRRSDRRAQRQHLLS